LDKTDLRKICGKGEAIPCRVIAPRPNASRSPAFHDRALASDVEMQSASTVASAMAALTA
jgi:hypothetical protein